MYWKDTWITITLKCSEDLLHPLRLVSSPGSTTYNHFVVCTLMRKPVTCMHECAANVFTLLCSDMFT